jgi:hypothetical protein
MIKMRHDAMRRRHLWQELLLIYLGQRSVPRALHRHPSLLRLFHRLHALAMNVL